MVHSSTSRPVGQPSNFWGEVSAPALSLVRSRSGPAELFVEAQPLSIDQSFVVSTAPGYCVVPVYETMASELPWISSTETLSSGTQWEMSFHCAPASETIAAMRDARSQAMRCDMKPPLLWP